MRLPFALHCNGCERTGTTRILRTPIATSSIARRIRSGRKFSVLLRRLKRNPEDAWAWRELTFDCLNQYCLADDRARKRLEPRITRYLAECDRTSAGAVQTVRAHALWAEYRGNWAAAVAGSLESIELDPGLVLQLQARLGLFFPPQGWRTRRSVETHRTALSQLNKPSVCLSRSNRPPCRTLWYFGRREEYRGVAIRAPGRSGYTRSCRWSPPRLRSRPL